MAILTSWLLGFNSRLNDNADNREGTIDTIPNIGSDFVGLGAPKSKFLFTVEFGIGSNAMGDLRDIKGARELETIVLDLKTASRPDISINYEDVNYYGVRTKVATKTNFGQLRLTFYEDAFNNINTVLWRYMNAVSPLTKLTSDRLRTGQVGEDAAAAGGTKKTLTTIGPLPNGWQDGLIEYIRVHHHYIGGRHHSGGVTTYTYYNPKLENLQYDELDMSTSEIATVTATFTADAITFSDNASNES